MREEVEVCKCGFQACLPVALSLETRGACRFIKYLVAKLACLGLSRRNESGMAGRTKNGFISFLGEGKLVKRKARC